MLAVPVTQLSYQLPLLLVKGHHKVQRVIIKCKGRGQDHDYAAISHRSITGTISV